MNSLEFKDLTTRVKESLPIVDIIGTYVNLSEKGKYHVGLCPWHDDHDPSLQVNPARGTYRCWTCGIGGDVFNFVMAMEGVEFVEALHMLADRVGIDPKTYLGEKESQEYQKLQTIREALEFATTLYQKQLQESPRARQYVFEKRLFTAFSS